MKQWPHILEIQILSDRNWRQKNLTTKNKAASLSSKLHPKPKALHQSAIFGAGISHLINNQHNIIKWDVAILEKGHPSTCVNIVDKQILYCQLNANLVSLYITSGHSNSGTSWSPNLALSLTSPVETNDTENGTEKSTTIAVE